MPKIVVNACYGGFGLSDKAIKMYGELAGLNLLQVGLVSEYGHTSVTYYKNGIESEDNYFSYYDIGRDDPHLVKVVETLKEEANGDYAKLRIADVPDNIKWYIDEYDGIESVHAQHDSW